MRTLPHDSFARGHGLPSVPMARVAVASTAMLYLVSLASPSLLWDDFPTDRQFLGVDVLARGWAGPIAGDLLWYANPIFFYVLFKAWKGRELPLKALWAILLFLAAAACVFPVLPMSFASVTLSWTLLHAQGVLFGAYLWAICMAFGGLIALTAADHARTQTSAAVGVG